MRAIVLKNAIRGLSLAVILTALPAFASQDEFRQLFTYRFPRQERLKIDSRKLGICFAVKAQKAKTGFSFDRRFRNPEQSFDDFVEYLGASASRKYDFSTGKEDLLREWILSRPKNSIDPYILFGASLSFNKGDLFQATLTIHQLLRNEARFIDARRYHYNSTFARHQEFFDRLIDIRGDLVERGPGFNGDHGGSWYRMWGTMLYEMMWMPEVLTSQGEALSLKQKSVAGLGNVVGQTLSGYVEISKFISPKEIDVLGKIQMGQVGARAANVLMKTLWGQTDFVVTRDLEVACANRQYLLKKSDKIIQSDQMMAAMLPRVDLTEQMSETRTQIGGTCYSYAFTAAVEAALYRKDQIHRQISPDFFYTRIFANYPQDSVRLFKTLMGNSYADGNIGENNADMFQMLTSMMKATGTYVEDSVFRPKITSALDGQQSDSIFTAAMKMPRRLWNKDSEIVQMYKSLYSESLNDLVKEPALRQIQLTKNWSSGDNEKEELLPILSRLLRAKIPPVVVFYYDLNKTQVNRSGKKSWVPLPKGLLTRPVWHAVVLQKIEKTDDGETYLIFRDSNADGTQAIPNMSQIRMRVTDAPELITQVFSVTGSWDHN